MNTIRITKEFTFEMAHALSEYRGKCYNVHGHSYGLEVTVKGKPLRAEGVEEAGMVMDFSILKQIVNEAIIQPFDHAFVIHHSDRRFTYLPKATKMVIVNYQPTCECMIIDFAERLQKLFPEGVALHRLMLRETATSYAEWYAEDNKSVQEI
ncbi:6-carboxytetrahydropterin synthase [Fulvivirga sp. 29W222]|uniref:6-carboxy-5,6,7,8-tetrahydropterin synthase n=1 Tax=Fulvivirga marina TaxID=2494733 RepID=A0A937G1Q6_9BACT|nr:6-carboxytetrahydropterin synthase [Fulvivirga marina]MBL6448992.1 6-carboxytetrahydropterin synthase [Fulvivirga marina]